MERATSIDNLVAALGLCASTNIVHTMLIENGCFVGHKLRFDGGYAIWQNGSNAMTLYDEEGRLLKMVALKSGKGAAA
jgi:hypothetical protein